MNVTSQERVSTPQSNTSFTFTRQSSAGIWILMIVSIDDSTFGVPGQSRTLLPFWLLQERKRLVKEFQVLERREKRKGDAS